jgi:hypothetical protein
MRFSKKLQQIFVVQKIHHIDDGIGGFIKSYENLCKIYGDMKEKFAATNIQQKKNTYHKNYIITVSKQTGKNLMQYKNGIVILYCEKKLPLKDIIFDKKIAQLQL